MWLATTCRDYVQQDNIGVSSLEIRPNLANLEGGLLFTSTISAVQHKTKQQGQCWIDMVRNPVIAVGYPVPARSKDLEGKGLELNIDLLIALGRVNWFMDMGQTIMFKGAVSALVAVAEFSGALCWHLLVNTGMSSLSIS